MDWLQTKYINLISSRLRNFKRKSAELYNFSCPYCLDSKQKKYKARGYIYNKKGNTQFHCHNCGLTRSFDNFLRDLDTVIHSDYIVEKLRGKKQNPDIIEQLTNKLKEFKKNKVIDHGKILPLDKLTKLSTMPENHACYKYAAGRQLPLNKYRELYYCSKFYQWTNETLQEQKFDLTKLEDHGRLVIPFWDNSGKFHAFQGRSLNPLDKLRYITIIVDDNVPKLYGLHYFNPDIQGYITEGPFDAMFIPNCLAAVGGDSVTSLSEIKHDKDSMTIIYDNEPRSKETIKKMQKAINAGYSVFFWPDDQSEMGKDLNKMVELGYPIDSIQRIVDDHSYRGLKALNELATWKRVGNVYTKT